MLNLLYIYVRNLSRVWRPLLIHTYINDMNWEFWTQIIAILNMMNIACLDIFSNTVSRYQYFESHCPCTRVPWFQELVLPWRKESVPMAREPKWMVADANNIVIYTNYTCEVWRSPCNMMVGRLLSFWDGIFSGAMVYFQAVVGGFNPFQKYESN